MSLQGRGKKQKQSVADYVDNLRADRMTGSPVPIGKWNDLHGDCKSSTGGTWTMRAMATTTREYKVQVLENGSSIKELVCNSEPSYKTIVSDLQADLGS